jgi:IS5 family transposase
MPVIQLGAALEWQNTATDEWADTVAGAGPTSDSCFGAASGHRSSAPSRAGGPCRRTWPEAMPPRTKVRSRFEHVFATEKHGIGPVVRTMGVVRATAKITLANLAYNMRGLVWIQGRPVPA